MGQPWSPRPDLTDPPPIATAPSCPQARYGCACLAERRGPAGPGHGPLLAGPSRLRGLRGAAHVGDAEELLDIAPGASRVRSSAPHPPRRGPRPAC